MSQRDTGAGACKRNGEAGRLSVAAAAASVALLLLVVLADMMSKDWAEQVLAEHEVRVIGEAFRLSLGYNTGVAFGIFANGGTALLIVTGLIIAALSAWLLVALRRPSPPAVPLPAIALILGGAIANFLDRAPDGRVTDFLDVGVGTLRWPTFNLADSAIVLGVGLLLLLAIRGEGGAEPRREDPPEHAKG